MLQYFSILLLLLIFNNADDEYRWYSVGVNDITSTESGLVNHNYIEDSNNDGFLSIDAAATHSGCFGSCSYLITYINGAIIEEAAGYEIFEWDKIRYTQYFYGGTSCWQIFGATLDAAKCDKEYGLIPYDSTIDTLIDYNIITGSWNGQTSRCDNDASNHWHIYQGSGYKGSLRVELRRDTNQTEVGIGTNVGCNSSPIWKYRFIEVGYDQNCEKKAIIKHINWDKLQNGNNNSFEIPYSNFSISVNSDTLETIIDIDLEYIGNSSDGNFDDEYNLGTTYVIDFQSFGTFGNVINEPGNCQNRLSSSFVGITDFNDFWEYSQYTYLSNALSTDSYLSYPSPSEYWKLSVQNYTCSPINYHGIFSFHDLIGCIDFNGNNLIQIEDDGTRITLSGTLYVNVISPYSMGTIDTGYYRSYALIQQDFSISIIKQINVISSTGIDLFITSIIGIYEDENDDSFKLSVLTQSADYIQLINPQIANTPLGTAASISSVTTSCLSASSYTCGQIFTVTINESEISCPPADFSGIYSMLFDVECRFNQQVCNTFISDNNDSTLIGLQVEANFIDYTCQPYLYQIIFDGSMRFYDDEEFLKQHNELSDDYVIGQDTIYVEIDVNFKDDGSGDNYNIFGLQIENVFVCTADDTVNITKNLNQQNGEGGCLSVNIDDDGEYNIIINGIEDVTYNAQIIDYPSESNVVRFSFLTFDVGRTTIYIHAQLTLTLQNGLRRRLLLSSSTDSSLSNQIRHFIHSTQITNELISETDFITTPKVETDTASIPSLTVVNNIFIAVALLNSF